MVFLASHSHGRHSIMRGFSGWQVEEPLGGGTHQGILLILTLQTMPSLRRI